MCRLEIRSNGSKRCRFCPFAIGREWDSNGGRRSSDTDGDSQQQEGKTADCLEKCYLVGSVTSWRRLWSTHYSVASSSHLAVEWVSYTKLITICLFNFAVFCIFYSIEVRFFFKIQIFRQLLYSDVTSLNKLVNSRWSMTLYNSLVTNSVIFSAIVRWINIIFFKKYFV